jgi:hypothetical protein
MRVIVRNLASNATHVADVESTSASVIFGATYQKPPVDTRAICGVKISDGVVMRDDTKIRCRTCRVLEERGL